MGMGMGLLDGVGLIAVKRAASLKNVHNGHA